MKMLTYFVPIVLSLLVLGAHFLRDGNMLFVTACLILVGLLFVRRIWAARIVQVARVLGTLEWLWTLYGLVQVRDALGQPYTRMSLILGAVAAITFASALLFQTQALRQRYRPESAIDTSPR